MIQQDDRGQHYININNDGFRITYVKASDRKKEADWAGCDVLRIQAYKGTGKSLNPGPEIRIKTKDDIYEIISALCHLVEYAKSDK